MLLEHGLALRRQVVNYVAFYVDVDVHLGTLKCEHILIAEGYFSGATPLPSGYAPSEHIG